MARWRWTASGNSGIGTSHNVASGVTEFWPVAGFLALSALTVEADVQDRARAAYTFKKLFLRVPTNTLTAASTFSLRINGANGNNSISVPGGSTGVFEEGDGITDSIVDGDLINTQLVAGATGTVIGTSVCAYDVQQVAGTESRVIVVSAGFTLGHSNTVFMPVAGDLNGGSTESFRQYRLRVAATFRNLRIFVTGKTNSAAGALALRVNGADGNQVISITGTGEFEDTTNSDTVASGILWGYRLASGTGHGGQAQTQEIISVEMDGDGRTTAMGANPITLSNGASGFHTVEGSITSHSTEADVKLTLREPQDAANYFVRCTAFSLDVAMTSFLRVNGADSLLGVSISGTGEFEDTADTISLGDGDEINHSLDRSASSSGSLDLTYVGYEQRQPPEEGPEVIHFRSLMAFGRP